MGVISRLRLGLEKKWENCKCSYIKKWQITFGKPFSNVVTTFKTFSKLDASETGYIFGDIFTCGYTKNFQKGLHREKKFQMWI